MRFPALGLFGRLAYSLGALLCVALLTLGYVLLDDAERRFNEEKLEQTRAHARTLADGSLDALVTGDYELLERWVASAIPGEHFAYAFLARSNGQILTHSDPAQVARFVTPVGELTERSERDLLHGGRSVKEIIHPAIVGRRHLANAHIAYYLDQDTFFEAGIALKIGLVLIIFLLLLLAASLLIIRRHIEPLASLTDFITTTSLDEPRKHIDGRLLARGDEVGALAHAFDAMISRLSASYIEVRKLSRAVEQSPNSIIITDIDGTIEYVNPAFTGTSGYTAEEVIGKTPRILSAGQTPPAVYEELWRTIKSGEHWQGELRNQKKNGTPYWEFASITPIKDEGDRITHFLGIQTDITERKQAEEQLRLQATAIESAANGIVITNREGEIQWVNPAFSTMTGYSLEEAIDQNPRLLKSGSHNRELYQGLWDTILSGRIWHGELINRRKDGSLYIDEQSITPVHNEQGEITHFVAIKQDITERKQAEEELQKHRDNLEELVQDRTVKLEAVNQELESFSYSVSHDLRAPLRAIDGFSLAVLEEHEDKLDAEGRDNLQRVRRGAQRMSELIDDLLQLSRITRQEVRHELVDMSILANKVLSRLEESEPDRKVEQTIASGIEVEGDSHLLEIVLDNLLENAWKYTSKTADPRIEFGVTQQDGERVYFVRDNGVGFNMSYANKLFGAFQRLHKEGDFPGTGIGLATVQRIIHRHGGRIWAEAEQGKGATFYFTIPEA